MPGAITQNPIGIGAQCVRRRRQGDPRRDAARRSIDTGFYWYDKSNINDPEIQAVLYQ